MARLKSAETIVEFGPGTGVFTEMIMAKKRADARFAAIEINPEFAAATRARCPGAQVFDGSAARLPELLDELGVSRCDSIVCGLPWASFRSSLQDELLGTIHECLAPGGVFLTLAYPLGLMFPAGQRFQRKLRTTFTRVETTRTVWRNLPPAFVYRAQAGLVRNPDRRDDRSRSRGVIAAYYR